MGFGYGTPMQAYHFSPASLPRWGNKNGLAFLDGGDRRAIHACYERYYKHRHGVMARRIEYWDAILEEPSLQTVGAFRDNKLAAYVVYSFERGAQASFLSNELHIRELVYDSTADLHCLLHYLHTQADQFEQIAFTTQDDSFYFLLSDPRSAGGNILPHTIAHESSTQGLGIMYRVIDVPRFFEQLQTRNFGGVSCRFELVLGDSFFPPNRGSYIVEVEDGSMQLETGDKPEVRLTLDVADFSSLVLGVIGLDKLVDYGLATLSDHTYLARLERLFAGPKPVCLTAF
jgi:predicted acetyltransferase